MSGMCGLDDLNGIEAGGRRTVGALPRCLSVDESLVTTGEQLVDRRGVGLAKSAASVSLAHGDDVVRKGASGQASLAGAIRTCHFEATVKRGSMWSSLRTAGGQVDAMGGPSWGIGA